MHKFTLLFSGVALFFIHALFSMKALQEAAAAQDEQGEVFVKRLASERDLYFLLSQKSDGSYGYTQPRSVHDKRSRILGNLQTKNYDVTVKEPLGFVQLNDENCWVSIGYVIEALQTKCYGQPCEVTTRNGEKVKLDKDFSWAVKKDVDLPDQRIQMRLAALEIPLPPSVLYSLLKKQGK